MKGNSMKREKIFRSIRWVLIVLLGSGVVIAQNISKQSSRPQIFVTERTHAFGKVPDDTVLVHTFVLHNVGNDSLHILRLKSG